MGPSVGFPLSAVRLLPGRTLDGREGGKGVQRTAMVALGAARLLKGVNAFPLSVKGQAPLPLSYSHSTNLY